MLNPTPWASNDPTADHSASLGRVLAYAATGGADGVISPDDCKVSALATPGASVRIVPGAWTGLNRATGARSQSFVGENATETVVPIAATGSGGGRRDMVCLVVADGEAHEVLIVSNVAAGVTRLQDVPGHEFTSGVALAVVTLPASTGTVTAGMITDVRRLASPQSTQRSLMAMSTGEMTTFPNPQYQTTFVKWPSVAEWDIDIPSWATHASIVGTIYGASFHTGDVWGDIRVGLDTLTSATSVYDVNWSGNPERVSFGLGVELAIPSSIRGLVKKIRFEARKTNGPGQLIAGRGTSTVLQVTFEQRPA